jgi:hypothetical protein
MRSTLVGLLFVTMTAFVGERIVARFDFCVELEKVPTVFGRLVKELKPDTKIRLDVAPDMDGRCDGRGKPRA